MSNRNAFRPAGELDKAASAAVSAIIVRLRDQDGLSFARIARRLAYDFDVQISRAAVWQRYQREAKEP